MQCEDGLEHSSLQVGQVHDLTHPIAQYDIHLGGDHRADWGGIEESEVDGLSFQLAFFTGKGSRTDQASPDHAGVPNIGEETRTNAREPRVLPRLHGKLETGTCKSHVYLLP